MPFGPASSLGHLLSWGQLGAQTWPSSVALCFNPKERDWWTFQTGWRWEADGCWLVGRERVVERNSKRNRISVACPLESIVPSTQPYSSWGPQSLPKVLGQCSGMADPKGKALPTKMENGSGVLADESCLICLYRFSNLISQRRSFLH